MFAGDYAGDPINAYKKTFDIIKAAGFDRADVMLWGVCRQGNWFDGDGFVEIAAEIGEMARGMGLPIYQTHGNTYSGMEWDDPNYPHHEYKLRSTVRCVTATKAMGASWMVVHPMNLPHAPLYNPKKAKEANLRYLAPFIEEAKRVGVGIAVENMVDFRGYHRRYCGGDLYELLDLVDTINDKSVGVCLDTGHANLAGIDNPSAIREIGSRLKCTHINDNRAVGADEHLTPYFGTVNWKDTVAALKEIGYGGDFSYELAAVNVDDATFPHWIKYLANLGKCLMSL